jgi:uncharacterized membrane protein
MVLTVVFWGLSIISTKVVLAQIPPVSIAFFRYSIATAILIPLALLTHSLPKITLKDLGTLLITSLLGIVLYFIFENNALQYTTASNASMLVAAMPLFAVIIEALRTKDKLEDGGLHLAIDCWGLSGSDSRWPLRLFVSQVLWQSANDGVHDLLGCLHIFK